MKSFTVLYIATKRLRITCARLLCITCGDSTCMLDVRFRINLCSSILLSSECELHRLVARAITVKDRSQWSVIHMSLRAGETMSQVRDLLPSATTFRPDVSYTIPKASGLVSKMCKIEDAGCEHGNLHAVFSISLPLSQLHANTNSPELLIPPIPAPILRIVQARSPSIERPAKCIQTSGPSSNAHPATHPTRQPSIKRCSLSRSSSTSAHPPPSTAPHLSTMRQSIPGCLSRTSSSPRCSRLSSARHGC